MSKRKVLSVDEKVNILQELEKGVKNVEVCKKYGLSSSTVSTLLKSKEKLYDAFYKNKAECKRLKKCSKEDLDEALLKWMKVQRSEDFPVSGPLLKVQAEKLAAQLGYAGFACSNGWIDRFKNRHGISFGKICGEAKSANMADITTWMKEKWPGIKEGYANEDIYNADETGLFYNVTPQYTFKFKGEKCVGGKLSKNRLTALVCANMSGTDKKKLLVIGKSKNPRCFKNVKALPVDYDHSRKAWMTSDIFTKLISKWEKQLRRENRQILLLIDNCSAHPEIIGLTNIRIEFLPPNSTSVIQPMDQGVIRSFKCHFRKQLILMLLDRRDKRGTTSNANINVLEAIRLMNDAWENVTSTCITKCYRKAGLDSSDKKPSADHEQEEEDEMDEFTENLEITKEEFENYVSIDNSVLTSDLPTTEDIVADILANSTEPPTNESDEDTDEYEYEEEEPLPSCSTMIEMTQKMQRFFEAKDAVDDQVFRALSLLRRTFAQEKEKEKVQTKLTSYFKCANK